MTVLPPPIPRPPGVPGWAMPMPVRQVCYWRARRADALDVWDIYHPTSGQCVTTLYTSPQPDHPLRQMWGLTPGDTPWQLPETALTAYLDEEQP